MIGKHADGECVCGEAETVNHVMTACVRYHQERIQVCSELKEAGITHHLLKPLLSGDHANSADCVMTFLRRTG